MKDVKQITDIPGIENYLSEYFILILHDPFDLASFYEHKVNDSTVIRVGYDIESKDLVEGCVELSDVVSREDIVFFSWHVVVNNAPITNYCYRPLVNESDKQY